MTRSLRASRNRAMDFLQLKNQISGSEYDRLTAYIGFLREQNNFRTFTVTGCSELAGATSVATNLAIALAETERNTLLVYADMRNGANARAQQEPGLAQYLNATAALDDVIVKTERGFLSRASGGKGEKKSMNLLHTQRFQDFLKGVKEQYDYVIFDTPSINLFPDAGIIASKTDASILVARQNSTRITQVENAKWELECVGANLLGIVFNQADGSEYKKYRNHHKYSYRWK